MSTLRTRVRVRPLSRRSRQVCAGIILLANAAGVAALVVLTRQSSPAPLVVEPVAAAPGSMRGVRSSIVRDGRLALRVVADSVALTRPRVLGPFRIGFLRAVAAQNLTVETWDMEPDSAPAVGPSSAATSVATQLSGALSRRIVQASAERVRMIRHRPGGDIVDVQAHTCKTTAQSDFMCRFGSQQAGDRRMTFREAMFDGTRWTLDGARD
jgi:hypothetical protein